MTWLIVGKVIAMKGSILLEGAHDVAQLAQREIYSNFTLAPLGFNAVCRHHESATNDQKTIYPC